MIVLNSGKISVLVIINLTRCSLKLDRVNLVAPVSPVYRARPIILTPAVFLPGHAVAVPGGTVQTRNGKVGSAQIEMYMA